MSWHRQANKWKSKITVAGATHHLGYFSDEEQAARTYDTAARAHRGQYTDTNFTPDGSKTIITSQFRGVSWDKLNLKWKAFITLGARHRHLGLFDTELGAAQAFDTAAREAHGSAATTNFDAAGKQVARSEGSDDEVSSGLGLLRACTMSSLGRICGGGTSTLRSCRALPAPFPHAWAAPPPSCALLNFAISRPDLFSSPDFLHTPPPPRSCCVCCVCATSLTHGPPFLVPLIE